MNKKSLIKMMLAVVSLLGFWSMAQAAACEVTTTEDNVPGSLRAAIKSVNSNNEEDTINLPAGTYFLSGETGEDANASGDLDIDTNHCITIVGEGMASTFIDGAQLDRVFHVLNSRNFLYPNS